MKFDRLIAPLARERFLSEYWTKTAVHLPGAGRTFDDVFTWEAVDAVLNAQDIPFPKVKVSRNDQPVPPERFTSESGGVRLVNGSQVLALFREGASFGITNADTDWPPLRRVIDCMYDTFLEHVHTNVYCSPANTQGFQCHFDLHEVFVLQVDGAKHWRVFRPTIDAPVESWKADDAPDASVAPYVDVVLRKGDVLYVPRGHWHYAVAEDTASVHVTVGVTCHKSVTFIDWLTNGLSEDPLWRRNLPLAGDATTRKGDFQVPEEWTSRTAELKRALLERLNDPDLAARFCEAMLRDATPEKRVSAIAQAAPLDITRVIFERPAGRRHFFEEGDGGVILNSGECDIELEDTEVEFFRRMFAAETFTADDVRKWRPKADLSEVTDVLTELVRSGLLLVKPR